VSSLSYGEINDRVLDGLSPPRALYYVVVTLLGIGIAAFVSIWTYQVRTGMGVAGISHPVGWGVYIGNFVFWVGIAHSGTLISAILHLVRSRWRDAVSRSAEAMTIFAVMTAGLFPLVHLGRFWVFYYIIPYPSERQLWPNFTSPLVWDVVAISTYFAVSVIFFYVGLLPDLASTRDRLQSLLGPRHFRTRLYRTLAMGWMGAASQWRHYGRGYLFFAALATPLVVSVHSVVSWDFAMGILPGWHTTIFPPYFVAGAIHSGLAMVLTLIIPMRRLLRLDRLITVDHLEAVAQTMIVTTLIIGYAYIIEPFIAWYSGDIFERQFALWRATGAAAPIYWALIPLNVLFPLCFAFKRVRRNISLLFIIAILVNVGMWLERVFIVVGSTAHDFLPHNWGAYWPTWVEKGITVGSFAFFLFWFFGFTKTLPAIAAAEYKEQVAEKKKHELKISVDWQTPETGQGTRTGLLAVFGEIDLLKNALELLRGTPFKPSEIFSPIKIEEVDQFGAVRRSPVRYWTLTGALAGLMGGFALAIGSALVNGLIVGGKHPVSIIPYCIIGFEGTILLGTIGNLIGVIVHARLRPGRSHPAYDPRFSRDKFGLLVACDSARIQEARTILENAQAQEIRVISPAAQEGPDA